MLVNSFKLFEFRKFLLDFKFVRKTAVKFSTETNQTKVSEMNPCEESSQIIKENTTEILVPKGKRIFYNPVQEFNRDLSVLVLQTFTQQFFKKNEKSNKDCPRTFRVLEALSATGLRSIRYAKEVPNITKVIANDISAEAINTVENNIKHNKVDNIVSPNLGDAIVYMMNNIEPPNRFQAVDLDPYGSPAQFLDAAVQCIDDDGILMVTCTDTSILCGHFPETCYAKYGALPLKIQGKHEMGLRIVLQCVQSHATRYKKYIIPLLSISVDFYLRIFVRIKRSPLACKDAFSKVSMVYECVGCETITLQPLGYTKKKENGKGIQYLLPHLPVLGGKCEHCEGAIRMGGPIWNAPIHDQSFVAEMISLIEKHEFGTSKRLLGVLTMILEELNDVPLYYIESSLCSKLKFSTIPTKTFRSAILNAGYRISYSHAARSSIKTDAPMSFIWDVLRQWIKDCSPDEKDIPPDSPTYVLLKSPIQNKIDFSLRKDADPESREKGLLRFQMNPLPNWGPGSRSTIN